MSKHGPFAHPVFLLVIAALIISFSSVLVKISNVSSTVSAFYRVFFGSLFLVFACAARGEFKKARGIKKNSLAVLCGLLFALDLWAWHLSIGYVGPGLATILGNCQVFVLSVVGFLVFKETITLKFLLSVPLAFLGLFLIIGVDVEHISRQYGMGVVLGLATAAFYSMFLLLLRKIQSDRDDFSLFYYLLVISFSCSVFLGVTAFWAGESFVIPDMTTLAALVGLGVLIQAIAWMMISNALPQVNASVAGLILLLQPALSFVWDVVLFNRATGVAGWVGTVIVLGAIYLGMAGNRESG